MFVNKLLISVAKTIKLGLNYVDLIVGHFKDQPIVQFTGLTYRLHGLYTYDTLINQQLHGIISFINFFHFTLVYPSTYMRHLCYFPVHLH